MPVRLEQPIRPFSTHVAHCFPPRKRLKREGIEESFARRQPLIPVERPPVSHLEQRIPFLRHGTAISEYAPDVAEVADVVGKREVVEVLGVVVAVVDGNVACDHHRFVVPDIGVCGQCLHEVLDVSPNGYVVLGLRFGEKRVTRSQIDCGQADELQEQSQAWVGSFRHTFFGQKFLPLPLHQGVVGSHDWIMTVHD